MVGAPPGAEVGLTYDADPDTVVDEGDVMVSGATGRRWLVVAARRQERGKAAGRWHLRCVVLTSGDPGPVDAVEHPLFWGPRT